MQFMKKGGKNMESIGVIRGMDSLGRVVIPRELRDLYKLEGQVEVVSTAEGILIRNPKYKLVENH